MTSTTGFRSPRSARPALSAILRNVGSNWFGILVTILLSFFIAPLTVRTLGDVYYGIWALLLQFTGYLWLFDFGVRESVVKYVAQHHAAEQPGELSSTVHTALSLYSIVAAATLLATAVLAATLPYAFNIPPDAAATARFTALLTGATVAQSFVFNVFVGVLMGLQKFYLVARTTVIFAVVRSLIIVLVLLAGQGIVTLALVQLSVTLASNLVIYRLAIRCLPYVSVRLVQPDWQAARKLLNYGKYVLLSNVGDKLVFASDSLVIGTFMPISSLTYYVIGSSLIDYFRKFITSMASVLNPLSSSLDATNDTEALSTVVLAGTKAAMIIGAPVCIAFILLGDTFIDIWMGEAYGQTAGLVLAVLATGYLIGLPYFTISGVLYGLGRHRIIAWSRLVEGGAKLALSVLLIRKYGLVGVALGTAIPHVVVVGCVLPAILPRMVPIRLRDYYLSTYVFPLLASAPFWGACWFIARVARPTDFVGFAASVAAALVTYAVPCWFLALSRPQRDHVRNAVGRRLERRLQPA
jgi:O-antigen/teichoic acid export membrane protein